ncbi:MAG: SLC13 family permease [Solitalea sp.]
MEIALVLILLAAAIVLFSFEALSVDIVTLLILFLLIITGVITVEEAYTGFGSDFIIMLAAIFVIGSAIEENGILELLGREAVRRLGRNVFVLTAGIMGIAIVLSAFMNNTTLTALLIAPVMSISRYIKVNPSKLLMPLAFASLLGGTCTLIGTSTNVAGAAYMASIGLVPISMFELLPLGVTLAVAGIIYMLFIGRHMIPERGRGRLSELPERPYLSEVRILPGSPMIGQSVYKSDLYRMEFKIHRIVRKRAKIKIDASVYLQEGDILFVEGNARKLLKLKDKEGIEIVGDTLVSKTKSRDRDQHIAEVLINKNSRLINQTLRTNEFQRRWGLIGLALHRPGKKDIMELKNIPLQIGDILLVQGRTEDINYLAKSNNLIVVGEMRHKVNATRRGWITFGLFILAIILGSSGILPISAAFMMTAVMAVLIRAIDTQTAYRSIDWRLLVLIGGMTAFGVAMENSGADVFLAELIANLFASAGPLWVMASFMVLTVILTQPMSNAAAALVVLPVAIQTAQVMDANPRSFAISIIVSASISMITPFEPSCILVYGPGNYKFLDFVRVGGLLTVLLLVIIVLLVPVFWPL